eukprot:2806908-Pyramimonas_sp.AAC.1
MRAPTCHNCSTPLVAASGMSSHSNAHLASMRSRDSERGCRSNESRPRHPSSSSNMACTTTSSSERTVNSFSTRAVCPNFWAQVP